MCVHIVEVAFLVYAGLHSVAGACTADRVTALPRPAAAADSRQPTTNAPVSCCMARLSWGPPRYAARARTRARWTCAQRWCTRVCVIGVGDDTCTGMW